MPHRRVSLLAAIFLASLASLFFLVTTTSAQTKTAPASAAKFDALAKQAAEARDADRLEDAAKLYTQALALKPRWAEGWWSLGTLEYDMNRYAPAARAFRELLTLAPKDGTAHAMLGLCEFELGQSDAALKHLQESKTLGVAENGQLQRVILYHEGVLLQRKGKFEAARDSLGQVCRMGQPDKATLEAMGLVWLNSAEASGPPPGTTGLGVVQQVGHGACLAAEKKFDEARPVFVALVTEFPDYPNIHYAHGRFLNEVNDAPGAVEQFKKEIANNPTDLKSRLEIASTLYKVDSAAGLPYAQEAVRMSPNVAFAHYLLGLLLLDTDDYKAAIPELEIAQKAFPKEARIYFALGSAYSRAGRKQDAERARAAFERLNQPANAGPLHPTE